MNDTTEFRCLFPKCGRPYQFKASLKDHITSRLAAPDENHPKGDPLFALSIAALKKHNLHHEEKRQRRQATNKEYYAKNKKNVAKLRLEKRRGYSQPYY